MHHLGVFMGSRFIGATQFNQRGHWEDVAFVELHKRIVGGWKRPCVDFGPMRKTYTKLIRSREKQHALWGFKDPRFVYVFPHFLRVVRAEVKVISVHRSLKASAQSMVKRRSPKKGSSINVNPKQAAAIARCYRDAHWLAMHYCWRGSKIRVQYEALVADPVAEVKRIAAFVGVIPDQRAIDFISPKLKHF